MNTSSKDKAWFAKQVRQKTVYDVFLLCYVLMVLSECETEKRNSRREHEFKR